MGLGLTFKKMLQHFVSEPDMIISSISLSIKDIIEILYFYFTELSLTACYVILFILAARYLLRKAPKIYSYSLWGIVYFKLVAVFKFDFWKHSFIPQTQIDRIYQNITPDYSAFYDTEAGVVSIVQSEIVTPPSITPVTPMYIPAFIWFIGVIVLLCLSFGAFVRIMTLTAGTKHKLHDNVYVCKYISSPFVYGLIHPKILLPDGLTRQEQHYVITHEKVHINRGDHIIKLFAFAVTCIHWFNPLVWLSFFLLEKDMEMSCDEKVISILGKEHKQDYSRCILSLATGKRFVPKAYLSFGDSDTKKRVKNVLNYKKPAVIASVMIVIGIVVIAAGMLGGGRYTLPPENSTPAATTQINFPVYDQRNGHNTEIFDASFTLLMNLPDGWQVKIPEDYDVAYPLAGVWNRMGIYDETDKLVGAIGYNIYDTTQTEPMAIFNQIALGNHYQFAVGSEKYHDTVTIDYAGTEHSRIVSTTDVYTSAVMAQQLGMGNNEVVSHGVLCRDSSLGVYVAIEIDKTAMDDAALNNFAHSVFIGEPVVVNPFSSSYMAPGGYDRFNFTLDGSSTDISLVLPEGWNFENRNIKVGEEPPYLTLDDNFSDVYDIFDDKRNNVGAFGFVSYNEQLGAENNLMAIYGAVALPNMYHFDVTENYTAVNKDDSGMWESAVTKVYHSPSLVHNNGGLGDAVYGDGILSYSRECSDFIAIEFEENLFSKEELESIAKSVVIKPVSSSYGAASALLYAHYRNIDTGTNYDISKYADDNVAALLNAKQEISHHRMQVFGTDKQSYDIEVIRFDWENWIENENSAIIKLQVVRKFRYNTANFDSSQSEVASLRLDRTEKGNFVVTEYRIDGKDTTFADIDNNYWNAVAEGKGKEFLDEFVREYKNFISNLRSDLPSKTEIAEFVYNSNDEDILYSFAQWYGFTLKDLRTLYKNNSWRLITEALPDINTDRTGIVLQMLIDGRTDVQIRGYVKEDLSALGITDDELRSFVHQSFHPMTVYCMSNEKIDEYLTSWRTPQPRLLSYENLAAEIADKYKNKDISFSSYFQQLPDDFVFPEPIMWDTRNIYQNEMGYFVVPIASAQGDNVMFVAINDNEYLSATEKNLDIEPFVQSVTFKNPKIHKWNLSVSCAKESTDDAYVITYCDDKIISESGVLYITNNNDFDIKVHFLGSGKEITTAVPANSTADLVAVKPDVSYTVGVHADVEENTEINLTIWETC
ncbi:MAG: hypothetical protein J6C04_07315 [Oscillospiraceae bacterium]|nr:hypothetical protein [Oscillospiraceae bacterium]